MKLQAMEAFISWVLISSSLATYCIPHFEYGVMDTTSEFSDSYPTDYIKH